MILVITSFALVCICLSLVLDSLFNSGLPWYWINICYNNRIVLVVVHNLLVSYVE